MKTRRKLLYFVLGLTLLLAVAANWLTASWLRVPQTPPAKVRPQIEAAPICPWHEPDADLRAFFPGATRHHTEVRILTGMRLELAKRLGRLPTADEHTLYLHRVYRGDRLLGTVLTRRVKGEYGAIEVVLAADPDGTVRGVRLQRLREPAPIAAALRSIPWLSAFKGKTGADAWQLGKDLTDVPPAAHTSAQAVVNGVRSLLILLQTAEQPGIPSKHAS